VKGESEGGQLCLKYFVHMYENRIMKPIKISVKGGRGGTRKSNRRDEFDQSTLYACMETSK
jgi:hypothetical protein